MIAPDWLSLSAYARTYGLSRHTVYRLLEEHALETYRIFKVVRIRNLPPPAHQPTDEQDDDD